MDNIAQVLKLKNDNKISYDDILNFINIDKSFEEIEELHTFLINSVIEIHKNEISSINTNLTLQYQNTKDCINKFEDKKMGSNIYFLNNEDTQSYILGDIHGDSTTVSNFIIKLNLINRIQNNEKVNLIFLGDYVDRGHKMFKTLELILVLKYIFPNNIFLIRGNHDGGKIICENEYKLCVGRNDGTTDKDYFVASLFNKLKEKKAPVDFLKSYLDFFDSLSNLVFIYNADECVMCVHGGIPRPIDNDFPQLNVIADLTSDDIFDFKGDTPKFNMLWSDPAESRDKVRDTRRFYFYEDQFENFITKFNIQTIVRGHQAFDDGYKEFFNKRILSIFSSGYGNTENVETSYKNTYPCVLKITVDNKEIIRLD